MSRKNLTAAQRVTLLVYCLVASVTAASDPLKSLTVCADPGNMPLSNQAGEGFENRIAQVIGASLGIGVQYYWRPSIERGLMRTTLSAGNCDLWLDMASDTEGAVVLAPLYRSTFVLAYRNDKNISIKSLDDPALKKLRIGVFQVSAMRQALAEHDIVHNTVIHYLSHNADIVQNNQPSYQVQQVIDGDLDVAAVWGPMAGYYKTVMRAPLTIQPANLMEDKVPMEFDMTPAVPRGRPDIKAAVEAVVVQHRSEIKEILADFGVPLVKCDECTVSGDLPSHGPYKAPLPEVQTPAQIAKFHAARMADLKQSLAQGTNPDEELSDAIVANDGDRVGYLLGHGAQVNSQDGDGYTPLISAIRFGFATVATYLVDHNADANLTDRSGWTPLMWAAWSDSPGLVKMLIVHGAKIDTTDKDGLTALAIAAQNGKANAGRALLDAGADANASIGSGRYSPLMLASISDSSDLATSLIQHGAKVNATNSAGFTALMVVAAGGRSSIAGLLLKAGADVNARSEDGRTALSIAQANSNDAVIKILE